MGSKKLKPFNLLSEDTRTGANKPGCSGYQLNLRCGNVGSMSASASIAGTASPLIAVTSLSINSAILSGILSGNGRKIPSKYSTVDQSFGSKVVSDAALHPC